MTTTGDRRCCTRFVMRLCVLFLLLLAPARSALAQDGPRVLVTASVSGGARVFSGGAGGAGVAASGLLGAGLRASLTWHSGHGGSLGGLWIVDLANSGPIWHRFWVFDAAYRFHHRMGSGETSVGVLAGPALAIAGVTCAISCGISEAEVAGLDRTSVGGVVGGFVEHLDELVAARLALHYYLVSPVDTPEIGAEHLFVAQIGIGITG